MAKMIYIIAVAFGTFTERPHFIRVNDGTFDLLNDPNFATTFTSKASAVEWANSNTTLSEYVKVEKLDEAIAEFEDWRATGMIHQTRQMVAKDISRKYNKEVDTPEDVLAWRVAISGRDSEVRYEDYRTWPELYMVFKHLWAIQRYYSDNMGGPLLTSFRIYTDVDNDVDGFIRELNLAIPHVTYKDDRGYLTFSLMDSDCSEYGTYMLYLDAESGTWYGKLGRFGHESKFSDITELFEFLRRDRPYRR